jgi:thiamine biosynthesis lipoprotein
MLCVGRVEYSAPPPTIKGAEFVPHLADIPRRRIIRDGIAAAIAAVLLAAVVTAGAEGAEPVEPVTLHGRTMGTTYNIRYWTLDKDAPAPSELQCSIDALLAAFDKQMSTWRPDSELSRFNAAPANEWFAVSPDVAIVTARALELHKVTEGALDVTISPLSTLWGFGPKADKRQTRRSTPTDAEIATALSHVGSQHLQVRLDPPALRKDIPELEVDLACLASGYAVDLIADSLREVGIDNAFVELGGEVRATGTRSDGKPWRIGVQRPAASTAAVARTISLTNQGLATSGDFHNFHVVDGDTYTHIIDPRTGRPLRYRGVSITIIANTGFAADGVATALCIMGPDTAYDWCVKHEVAALILESQPGDDVEQVRTAPAFDKLTTPTGSHGTTAE